MIPYGRQSLNEDDIAAVLRVLRSDYLTTGPEVDAFEQEFSRYVGAEHAVAVSSATAALHLLMIAMKLEPGDRVLTSPNTFLSSANAVAFCGATPDFCDTNASGNMDLQSLQQCWLEDVRGVVVVDYAGQPADLPGITDWVRSNGGFVIEDASHALGSRFDRDQQRYFTGGHPWADATVFSFHPVKTLTTGEGGMITTSDARLAEQLRRLRHHGVERDTERWLQADEFGAGPWYYEMQELGYNYRITDLQCALGRSQLKRIEEMVQRRLDIVSAYNEAFADLNGFRVPAQESWLQDSRITAVRCGWHLYSPQVDFAALGTNRNTFMRDLRQLGVGSQVLYLPVHLQPWYRQQFGYGPGKCPQAERFFEKTISLPLFAGMSDTQVSTVIQAVRSVVATRR